jgi:hypothetical protein
MKKSIHRFAAGLAAAIGIFAPPAGATNSNAEVIVEWNQLLQANMPSTAGLLTPRYFAMLHIAMFDAANAIEREYTPYHARLLAHPAASTEAAAAQAGHDVLVALIPTPEARAAFDAALQARLAGIQPWRAAAGSAVGHQAASDIIGWRAHDGSGAPNPVFTLPTFPGLWQPTSAQGAQFVLFGEVTPFALLTPTQYLPDPPPTLTSERYTRDFDEVKTLGSATSTVRTAEQTQTARLFASVGNSTIHFAMWNIVARDVARRAHWSLVDTARLFALMNASMHDGLQSSHTSKFVYGLWRPVTAIRRADEDMNSANGRRCRVDAAPHHAAVSLALEQPDLRGCQLCAGAGTRVRPRRRAVFGHLDRHGRQRGCHAPVHELFGTGAAAGAQPRVRRHPLRLRARGQQRELHESRRLGGGYQGAATAHSLAALTARVRSCGEAHCLAA